ncbi:lantibiotic dehydratase [Streptomyces sp. NPDC006463]|uniref:lantibiotic dehydratase n=1 Tax=Streptomyces sp. NPDC006463 TaxID=3364746 RepID=UPI00368DCFF5
MSPPAAAAWDRLLTAAAQTLAAAREADAELEARTGQEQDEARVACLRMRRRIRDKPLTPPTGPAADAIGPVPAVHRWAAAARAYRSLLLSVTREREHALIHERLVLSGLCADPALSSSIELVSPDMGAAVRRYAAGRGSVDRADRKSEPRITAYVLRGMTRTSPRSRFTAVAHSALPDDATADGTARWEAAPPSELLRGVDVQRGALLSALEAGLEADADAPGHVRLAPLLTAGPSELAFMAITPAHPRPRKVTLRRGRELTELVAAARFGVHDWATLVDTLATALDCPPGRARQVMRAALGAGLLAPALAVDDQDPDFLRACLEALPDGGGLRSVVAEMAEVADRLALDDVTTRPDLHGRLRTAAARLPHADALAPQVYEDAVATLPAAPRPAASLRSAVELLPVLRAFDLKADFRLALQAAVRARGGKVRLLDEAEGLAEEAARLATAAAAGQALPDPDTQAAMADLWGFRHRVLADTAQVLASASATGDGVDAVLGEELVRTWTANLPAWLDEESTSYALMAQHAAGTWVVNSCFGGYGATASRFLRLDGAAGGDATDRLRRRLRRVLGPGVAEDRAAHGFNTGCHPRLLDETMEPADWSGTFLVDDGSPGRLGWHTPRGLRPMTITSTRWDLLPAPSRIVLWLQGGGAISCAYDHFFRESARPGPDGVVAVPRLLYGDLVLQRRRWYLPDTDVLTGAHRGTADDLHRLVRVLAEHGVPARFFVKQLPAWQRGEALVPDVTTRPAPQPKPRFVDTAGALGLASFAKDAADFTHPYLEECLPEPLPGRSVREAVYEFDAAEAQAEADAGANAEQEPGC